MVGKSFLKIGTTYFDIGPLCSFNFYPDKHGYVIMFLHFLSKDQPIKVKIKNKNELSEFFYGLDKYIDQDFRESFLVSGCLKNCQKCLQSFRYTRQP